MRLKDVDKINYKELHYIFYSYFYKWIYKRVLMIKYKIGDCFVDKHPTSSKENFIYIVSIDQDFCSIKFIESNYTFTIPLYRLDKLKKIGNIYQDEKLKILFFKS